ncbi:MAG: hypothetical protein HC840_05030 [Leptolyngbyaceae cyanobacterium RM2_2_4]|nr:hypothetical protein [Leptolyngbyaceae cyanobacterium RM2_2_4]
MWSGQSGLVAEFRNGDWIFLPSPSTTRDASNFFLNYTRIYSGVGNQPDPLIQSFVGADSTPGYRGRCYVVHEGLPLTDKPGGTYDFGGRIPRMTYEVCTKGTLLADGTIVPEKVTVQEAVTYYCLRAGLQPNDFDVSELSGDFFGYCPTTQKTAGECIAELGALYFFDATDSDKLRFRKAQRPVQKVIPQQDLGVRNFGEEHPTLYTRTLDEPLALPYEIGLIYFDRDRELQEDFVYARKATALVDVSTVETSTIPIVIDRSQAQSFVDKAVHVAWIRRRKYENISLGHRHLDVQCGDRIGIQFENRLEDLVVTEIDFGASGVKRLKAFPYSWILEEDIYRPVLPVTTRPVQQSTVFEGDTSLYVLDINLIEDSDPDAGVYVAARGQSRAWRGAAIFASRDGGANYGPVASIASATTMGVVANALAPNDNTFEVSLESGELLSPTGLFLLGDEILSAQSATLVGVNRYQISGLSRGRRGTEFAISTHQPNERFYLLSETVRAEGQQTDVGEPLKFKALTGGQSLGDVDSEDLTVVGRSYFPYSPVDLQAFASGSDIVLRWTRRDRKDNSGSSSPKLSEFEERYEVEIFNGTTAIRTLDGLQPQVTYTQARQILDFGSLQTAITYKVFQISAVVGRGYPATYSGPVLSIAPPANNAGTTASARAAVASETAQAAQITADQAQTNAATAQGTANQALDATRKKFVVESRNTPKNLTLLSEYFQFIEPTAPTVAIRLPNLMATDYYETEIVNDSLVNALDIQDFGGNAIILLSPATGVRSVYIFWTSDTFRVFERAFY